MDRGRHDRDASPAGPSEAKRHVPPMLTGFLGTAFWFCLVPALIVPAFVQLEAPSADFFRTLAGIAVGLLIAYTVQMEWLAGVLEHDNDLHQGHFSGTAALAFGGVVGLGLALLGSERVDDGHTSDYLLEVCTWGSTVPIGLLALFIALYPFTVFNLRRRGGRWAGSRRGGDSNGPGP